MDKRSRRRIPDLVALAASQGLSQNEIGCARISMMARRTNAPCKGRIQKRKTTLHLLKSDLQRTAGLYKGARSDEGSGAPRGSAAPRRFPIMSTQDTRRSAPRTNAGEP
jgi:hypothetical protein